jgi:hypothetical protein
LIFQSQTPQAAIITGGSTMFAVNASYVDIVGFTFDGSSNSSAHIAISSETSTAGNTTNVRILNNVIHDIGGNCNNTQNAVILMNAADSSSGTSVGDNVIDGNYLYHNNCGKSGSSASTSGMHGIYSVVSGDVIQNNVIVDQGGGWCIQAYHRVTNWTVTNNTLVGCAEGGIVLSDDTSTGVSPANTTITNNVVVNSGGSYGGIVLQYCSGSNNVIENNLMYGNTPGNYLGSATCGATLGSTQTGSNSIFVDYTGTGAGNYALATTTGNAAVGNGTMTCASGMSPCVPTTDYTGAARPDPPSIGAYE